VFAPNVALVAPKDAGAGFHGFVEAWKPLIPGPILALVLVLVWLFFRGVWRELDEESLLHRAKIHAEGKMDLRPFVALALIALILTMQDYYGGRMYFEVAFAPKLRAYDLANPERLHFARYEELYAFGWWAATRVGGYGFPFVVWKILFRKDSIRDLGFRTKGFFDHVWIYGLFLAVVLPAMLVVANAPDFGTYYPFYKQATRSWFDFLVWEAMYFAQFFALEMFFRGFFLGALRRSFGSGAIFVMCAPYCMIHFGKPYLEACGAIIAGMALGSLSMKTKSIYQGFMVHITVAALMDWLALRHRKATPLHLFPKLDVPPLPTTKDVVQEELLREELASTVERVALVVFVMLGIFMVAMVIRSRRRRLERLWVLPEPRTAE